MLQELPAKALVRYLWNPGGMTCRRLACVEDNRPGTLAEAMAALEKGLAEYFEREGIEVA